MLKSPPAHQRMSDDMSEVQKWTKNQLVERDWTFQGTCF